jgi:choline dehydrogenase-like flavoprotein
MDASDVIIIGTGPGGGTLARHLAPSGKRVLGARRLLLREPSARPHEERDPGGRVCASGRYLPVRHGSRRAGVEHRLPGQRARQPLRRERERLADLGGRVLAGSPADFEKRIADETENWGKVVELSGAKPG